MLIATPGRLLDLLRNHLVVLNQTNYIVLDEADRMIDEGFEQDVNTVMGAMGSLMKSEEEEEVEKEAEETESLTSKYRTTIMFSATMAPEGGGAGEAVHALRGAGDDRHEHGGERGGDQADHQHDPREPEAGDAPEGRV